MANGRNTIRKTLLDFAIDASSKKAIKELTEEFAKLEKVTQSASAALTNNLKAIKDSPQGRSVLVDNAKNEVNTSRQIIEQNQKNARAILNQIALEAGKGLNSEQRQQMIKGLDAAFGEVTGRFVKQAKVTAKKQAKSLADYYDEEFRRNPLVPRGRRIATSKLRGQSETEIRAGLERQKLLQTGANSALKTAVRTGDARLEAEAAKAVTQLAKGADAAQAQLAKLTKATQSAQATTKEASTARAKTLKEFYAEEFRRNPTIGQSQRIQSGKVSQLNQTQLTEALKRQAVYQSAAEKALKQGISTGNTRLENNAATALKGLSEGTKAAKDQLKVLTEAAKDAAQAEKAKAKTTTQGTTGATEQQRVNRRIEQLRQTNTNNRLDGGAQQFRNQGQLLRNYAVMGAGVGGLATSASFSTELDRQFKQLQSIVNLTNEEMEELSTNLIDVSEKTKFTATDVADAAITLGQAGLGQGDIQNAIEGVTLFATAVGSDLKSAVDLATSTLGVFNKDSSQMTNIVDKMTTAVNNSKLNLDKLALGLQYSGNLAAQSNVTFEETVSALGAMANSGIRAGSTLGTGLRQIIIALQKPSEGFTKTIHGLGLSMSDLDITTHGLIPVMRTLAEAGFTVRDAMETMQVRAASAYGAFANNINVAEDLSEQMQIGGSAARANATQMGALSNQLDRMGSISKSIVYESLEPLLDLITSLTEKTADFLSVVRDLGPVLSALAIPATILGSVLATRSVLNLGAGLLGGAGLIGNGGKKSTLSRLAKVSGKLGIGRTLGFAARAVPAVGAATAVGTAAVYGYKYLDGRSQANDKVDSTQASLNRGQNETKVYENQLNKVGSAIDTLILKQHDLTDSKSLQREIRRLNDEFRQQGLYLDSNVDSYDKLIAKMLAFETSTSDGVSYLQTKNRNNLLDNSEAKLEELNSEGLFDSRAQRIVTEGFSETSEQQRTRSRVGRQTGVSRSSFQDLISSALPNFDSDLANINEQIKNIAPKSEGAFGRAQQARISSQELQSQIYNILNQSPQALDELMKNNNLSGKSRKAAEEAIEQLAETLLNRANVLLEVEINQREYLDQDPTKKATELETRQFIQGRSREVLGFTADAIEDIEVINKDADTDYLQNFRDINTLIREKTKGLLEEEEKLIADLEAKGVENPRLVLQGEGYYKAQGEASGRLNRALQSSAQSARPDASLYYPARLAELDKELTQLKEQLREVTDRERSQEILERAKELNFEREKVANEQDTIFAGIDGNSPAAVKQRDQEFSTRVIVGSNQLDTLQQKTFAREDLKTSLSDRDPLLTRDNKLIGDDNELSRLLADFIKKENTLIETELAKTKQEAENLRRQAEDINRESSKYVDIASDEGFTDATRTRASGIANGLNTEAYNLEQQAIALEEEGVRTAKEALADLAEYLRTQILDNPELAIGRSKGKVDSAITDIDSSQRTFDGDLDELSREAKEAKVGLGEFRDSMGELVVAIKANAYSTSEFLRSRAAIYGTTYTPEGNTAEDEEYSSRDGSTVGNQISNSGQFIYDEVQDSYQGFDMLTQITLDATEAAKGMGNAFGSALGDMVTGVADVDEAFKGFFANLAVEMANIATNAIANQVISSMFGAVGIPGLSVGGMYTGGPIIAGNYAAGGLITSGMATRDSTYAHVSRGEFILRKQAVDAIGLETVRSLNAADSNSVSGAEQANQQAAESMTKTNTGEGGVTNVYVVNKESVPQTMGPNDVVATVGDNIARDGTLATLIASVKMR